MSLVVVSLPLTNRQDPSPPPPFLTAPSDPLKQANRQTNLTLGTKLSVSSRAITLSFSPIRKKDRIDLRGDIHEEVTRSYNLSPLRMC